MPSDPKFPRPRGIRPKIILAKVERYVVFDFMTALYWMPSNDWGSEAEARIYDNLHDALEDANQLRKQYWWNYLLNDDPGKPFWN